MKNLIADAICGVCGSEHYEGCPPFCSECDAEITPIIPWDVSGCVTRGAYDNDLADYDQEVSTQIIS